MAKNIVFMTAMVKAPDVLNYAEWCYNTWDYWCKKNDVQLFILEDELRPKGDGTMKMDPAAKAAATNGGVAGGGTVQTIRIEQMPLKIIAADIPASLDPKKKEPPTA